MLWADILYGMDRAWWNQYWPEVRDSGFDGRKISSTENVFGAETVKFFHGGNSGAGAISLAFELGAEKVILLGYDCQATGGKKHHHDDHPHPLGNAGSLPKWPAQFQKMKDYLGNVDVVNATRETALDCWPLVSLEEALCTSVECSA